MAAVVERARDLWSRLPDFAAEQAPTFVGIARRWLESDGDPADKALRLYVERLEDRGLKDGTINQNLNTIRRYIGFCGLPTPKCAWWHYDPQSADRKAFSGEAVALIVEAARRSPSAVETARMAVCSVYGLRSVEAARIRPDDVDLQGQRLYIRTAKNGVKRWCWIPPEVAQWLDVAWVPTTPRKVLGTLDALWGAAVAEPRPKGAGIHALRRSLTQRLNEAGVAEERIERFMRWRRSSMVSIYARPNQIVGPGGGVERVHETDQGLREADAEVWVAHPVVPLWR